MDPDAAECEPCLPTVAVTSTERIVVGDSGNTSDVPGSGSDGSSYGSTGSHRNLLTNQTPGTNRANKSEATRDSTDAVA